MATAAARMREGTTYGLLPSVAPFQTSVVRRQVFFPDRKLIQFDCGKLQQLATLLRQLKAGGHKVSFCMHAVARVRTAESERSPDLFHVTEAKVKQKPRMVCFRLKLLRS